MLAVVIAEGVAIALLAVLVLGLLRSHALILRALHELGAGLELEKDAAAGAGDAAGAPGPVAVQIEPGVVPATRDGVQPGPRRRREDLRGRPAAGRARRRRFRRDAAGVPHLGLQRLPRPSGRSSAPTRTTPGDARLVVVAKGSAEESPATLAKLARPGVEVVASSGAWVDYDIPGSPYFVLVEDGVVTGEGSATNWPSVRDLLQQAVHESAHARAAAGRTGPGGDPAAALRRPSRRAPRRAGGRDDLSRIDAELAAAGIHPGHHSLFEPADPVDDDEATGR